MLGSQSANVQQITDVSGLAHEVFANGIKWQTQANSPTSQLFNRAQRNSEYKLLGEKLVGAVQLSYANGAMATAGKVPDHEFRDAQNWETTPIRRYRRIAQDNFTVARARGEGAFDDLGSQIFDQLWDSWSRMQIRHSIGDSRGYICLVESRTSSTQFVAKDGYGHPGTNPLLHIEPAATTIAWLDASNALAVGGAGRVTAVNYSTRAVTVTSASTWEPSAQIAADDVIVMATTGDTTKAHFETEFGNAPHGVMGIVDPDANFSTVLNIAEATNPRWKPFRQQSVTFDHFEVAEHWRKLRAYSTAAVGPGSHVAVCQGAVSAELARTLGPYQQQQQMGREFMGGYTAVRISIPGGGTMDFVEDDYFIHDALVTLCTECLYRGDLEEADFYAEDGSMWSRLADEDKQEAFVREYMQTWTDQRNRHAALTGIALPNTSADDFSPVPR